MTASRSSLRSARASNTTFSHKFSSSHGRRSMFDFISASLLMTLLAHQIAQTSSFTMKPPTTSRATSTTSNSGIRVQQLKPNVELNMNANSESNSNSNNLILTWEKSVEERIREEVAARQETHPEGQPFLVAVVGIPGSGKSTSSEILVENLKDVGAMLMPFDGYHYPLAALEQMPNAKDVIYRRGALDTFDLESIVTDLRRIKYGKAEVEEFECPIDFDEYEEDAYGNLIHVPGFDHAKGDPEPACFTFDRSLHKVVVCEGLYLLNDTPGWSEIKDLFDFTVFLEADINACMDRLKIRNRCIPGYTPEEIDVRVDAVDRLNALMVEASKVRADLVVPSATFASAVAVVENQ